MPKIIQPVSVDIDNLDFGLPIDISDVTGLQSALDSKISVETDPTVPAHVKGISAEDILDWNSKQAALGYTPVPNTRLIAGNILNADISLDDILGVNTVGILRRTSANTLTVDTSVYLTGITKAMIESELTGNITSHTHNQYLTTESDPTVPAHVKGILSTDISNWNGKQDTLVSGNNIKTINTNSILGSGNINVVTEETDPLFTAWNKSTGISITESQISDFGDYLESVAISDINATGTPGSATYLRGDGTWATVSASGMDWADITNKPSTFTPSAHTHTSTDITDFSTAVTAISPAGARPASDVSAWAKAATKPSYTFSEIGSKPTTVEGYGITDAYQKYEVDILLAGKVNKVGGMGLSTNDYTNTEKSKLSNIEAGAEVNVIEVIKVNGVAQSISNKEVDITVSAGAVDSVNSQTGVVVLDADDIDDTSTSHKFVSSSDISRWNDTYTKTEIDALELDITEYVDLADIALQNSKQDNLVSGTNIKTINSVSILGSGDISTIPSWSQITSKPDTISGFGITDAYTKSEVDGLIPDISGKLDANSPITGATYTKITYDSKGLVTSGANLIASDIPELAQSKITNLATDLSAKQATLVSGTNIKTINSTSLLGSGDIAITKTSLGLSNVDNTADAAKYTAGVIESNAVSNLGFWVGTQTEYDAITTPDAGIMYIIKEV